MGSAGNRPDDTYLLAALDRSFNKPTQAPTRPGHAARPTPLVYLTFPSPVLLQALKAGYCIQATGPKLPKPEPKPMPLPLPGELPMAAAAMGGPGLP